MATHELHISYDDQTGQVSVKGAAINNPIVAFGMLQFAHDNIQRLIDRQQSGGLQFPSQADVAAIAKKPNGA